MNELKDVISRIWQPIVIIVLVFLLFKQCEKEPLVNPKSNSDFYLKAYLEQSKKTALIEKKADSLEKNVKTVYLPKWSNRTKVKKIETTNDTIIQIVQISQTNEAICDTVIDKMSETIVVKDSVITSVKIEVDNLVISHNLLKKDIKKEKRKKTFWQVIAFGLLVGLIIK
jgi:hypothetical protein